MARLPSVSNNTVLTQGPRSSLSAADIANPYQQIAQALGSVGTTLQEHAINRAAEDGADAVYRDAGGNLKVDQRSNFTKSGEAYNRAAMQAYTARLAGDIRSKGTTLMQDAQGNVDNFSSSWKGFSDTLLEGVPKEARGAVKTMLDVQGSQFGLGVSEQKRTRDIKVFENDLKTEIQFLNDEMAGLARGGGVGTTAYKEKQNQLRSLYGELVANPEFTVSQKQADMDLSRIESRHLSEALVGSVDKQLTSGGIPAAQKEIDRILTDEKLSLSPSERRQYAGMMEERVRGWQAERKVALKPFQDQKDNLKKLFDQGVAIDNPDVDTTIAALANGGDMAGALELSGARNTARIIQNFKLADPESRVGALERGVAAANGINTSHQNTPDLSGAALPQSQQPDEMSLSVIRKHEGFRNTPYWDVNAHRVGYGSDTITQADGTVRRVTKDMRISREDAERDLNRRIGEFQQGIRQDIGGSQWNAFNDNIKAALTSVAYNYGSLPKSVVAAAQTGDPQRIATAIQGLSGHNAGINAKRRYEEAAMVMGDALQSTATAQPVINPEIIKEYRSGVTADAKAFWPDIKAGIEKGMPPSGAELSLFSRQISLVDDPQFRSEVGRFFESEAGGAAIAQLPKDQAEAVISALKADASAGATIAQQDIITSAERQVKAQDEALKADPIGFAMERRMAPAVPALDLTGSPEDVASAFSARQTSVDLLRARGLVGNVSALRPDDVAMLTRTMQNSTPQQNAQLLGSMSANLKPDTYMATMTALAGNSDSRKTAMAGALYQKNPDVAEGVLRGQALLKENPLFAPKKTDSNREEIDVILPSAAFGSGLEGTRQSVLEAATARYADLSNLAGDTSGDLNDSRMEQAVNEVTGGMLDFNGEQIIAPRYGMKQDDFDDLMRNLPDGTLNSAVTSEGEPITAREIIRSGRLKAIGEGRYLIAFGADGLGFNPVYAMKNTDEGGPFILDLRERN